MVGALSPEDDFTRGEARGLWESLVAGGALVCDDARAVVRCVEEAMAR
jgi:hypothetical protein